jgi:diguanylate cyclase (GGDEF)-like protein/PAS domain S-box-containing protein
LDIMMPKIDGFEVCAAIRNLPDGYGQHTAILVMTGLNDMESINRAYEVGATDFITKPINWMVLGNRLRYMWRAICAKEELRRSEEENRALISAMPDTIFRISRQGTILDSKIPRHLAPVLIPERLLGKRISEVFLAEAPDPFMDHIEQTLRTGENQVFEHPGRFHDNLNAFEFRIVVNGKDEVLAIVRDITEKKQAEERIIELAYYDTLTGLLNRHSFTDHLNQALAQAERHGRLVATLFLDLDRFKLINDTLGHDVGDLLLQGVAERMLHCLRKGDTIGRFTKDDSPPSVARWGGDEFSAILTDIGQIQDAAKAAGRVRHALSQPFLLAGHEVFVTASIGITVYPLDGSDADTVLKNADTAMYHAKEQGRDNFQFYTASMNASAFERLAMENKLRRALDREEFLLHYQPQLDLRTGRIVGVEALIRWNIPGVGLVPPAEFIPLAEETGLIVPIGAWVLQTACAQNSAWRASGLPPIRMAINLSSRQFRQKNLVETVKQALVRSGLQANYLELEMTESVVMQNAEETTLTLHELKGMGLRLAVDDFGTGYSSLSYLKRFPVDVLKIDRSFIGDLHKDPDDAAIARAIIAIGHSLNLRVVAEGVETEDQLKFLRQHDCDEIQGYLFSRPRAAEAIEELLRDGRCLY